MSTTLKTYDDGSTLTPTGVAATVGLCVITGTIGAVAAVKWSEWKERRFLKRNNITPNNM